MKTLTVIIFSVILFSIPIVYAADHLQTSLFAPVMNPVTQITDTSVLLTWQEPTSDSGDPITSYKLNYVKVGFFTRVIDVGLVTSYTFEDLESNTDYRAVVWAVNSGGPGLYSNTVYWTTLGEEPIPEPPQTNIEERLAFLESEVRELHKQNEILKNLLIGIMNIFLQYQTVLEEWK